MPSDYLSIYLNDHLAGATAGRNLARRAARHNQASAYGLHLADLAVDIDRDRAALLELMRRLEVRPNRVKVATGWLAELVARGKANGHVFTFSPLSRVDELEGLLVGVRGKLALWAALRTLQETDPRIAPIGVEGLIARAEGQLTRLEDLRLQAFQGAMLGDAPNRD